MYITGRYQKIPPVFLRNFMFYANELHLEGLSKFINGLQIN